jgi:hypothetical protein
MVQKLCLLNLFFIILLAGRLIDEINKRISGMDANIYIQDF